MGNYKEDKISGWQRSNQVKVINQLGQDPRIVFDEEIIVNADGSLSSIPVGSVESNLSGLVTETISRLNPADNSVIGIVDPQITAVDLYSVYMFLANRRDNPPVVPAPTGEV